MLLCVSPGLLPYYWPRAHPFIESAMIRGSLNEFSEIEQAVLSGAMLLWIAWDGSKILSSAVTQLNRIGGEKIGTIVACGGNELERFAPLIEGLEEHFRAEGCKRSRIMGRPGWSRIYPAYKTKAVLLEKAL